MVEIETGSYTEQAAYTLAQVAEAIRDTLEGSFPDEYMIIAEVGSISGSRGHCYLTLIDKDEAGAEVTLRGTIWAAKWRVVEHYFASETGTALAKGMRILLRAQVRFSPTYGLSLNILDIDPTFTVGEKKRERDRIIKRIQQEGLDTYQKELVYPAVPQRIAVISSATAAGYQDFVHQLEANPHGFVFAHMLFTSVMQGEGTESGVLNALAAIRARAGQFDLVAIIRGGGGETELASFDSYAIAKAMAEFPLPILTGIGHERDVTVPDLVAYERLKTPTAVAEHLIGQAAHYNYRLGQVAAEIAALAQHRLAEEAAALSRAQTVIINRPSRILPGQATKLTSLCERITAAARALVEGDRHTLELSAQAMRLADPRLLLARGFALVRLADGSLLRSTQDALSGQALTVQVVDGTIKTRTI